MTATAITAKLTTLKLTTLKLTTLMLAIMAGVLLILTVATTTGHTGSSVSTTIDHPDNPHCVRC